METLQAIDSAACPFELPTQPLGSHVVVAIPAYNEERFIGSLVIKLKHYFSYVVVIDDGSTDDTASIAQQAGAVVVTHKVNGGKTAGVNSAFRIAHDLDCEALVLLDGDGQHRAEDALAVLAPVLAGKADMVVGSRYLGVKSEIPTHRVVGQIMLNTLTSVSSGVQVSDSQSGLRAFSAKAVELLDFQSRGFAVESEMQFAMQTHRLRVAEVPIQVLYREPDKRNPFVHGIEVVNGILRLVARQRPLLLFGGSGFIMTLAGIILGLLVAFVLNTTHELAIGYALLTVLLIVVGTISMFAGMMLNSLAGQMVDVRQEMRKLQRKLAPSLVPAEVVVIPAYRQPDDLDAYRSQEQAR